MKCSKFLLLFLLNCITSSAIIRVEVINNSLAGIKVTYSPQSSPRAEKFIESGKSFTTPELSPWITQLLINTYKGPLTLDVFTSNKRVEVPGRLKRRGRLSHDLPPTPELVTTTYIKAELSAEYPISQAQFTSGRPWDEYKIQVIIEEKTDTSKVSIGYKQLEKPEPVRVPTFIPPQDEPTRHFHRTERGFEYEG